MSERVNRISLGVAGALLLALPAAADLEDARRAEERWAPSLAITSGVFVQRWDGSVDSRCDPTIPPNDQLPNPPQDCTPSPVRDLHPVSGKDVDVSPSVGVNLELMSPTLPMLPGRPRLFVSGGYLATFGAQRDLAKEGNPKGFELPTQKDPDDLSQIITKPNFDEAEILGVGSAAKAQLGSDAWEADIGLAFPFQVRERQLRVKPSFAWVHYEVEASGTVLRAIKPQFDGQQFRAIEISGAANLPLDGIGPGLEVEMDIGRWGPLRPTLFLGGRAYRVLGKRGVAYSGTTTVDEFISGTPPNQVTLPGPVTYDADWYIEVAPWMYRAGVGFRFRWVGSE